jgi:Na+/proline symporter
LATLVLYAFILLGIAAWASRRTGTQENFLLGGRSLGPWIAGLAYAASSSSAWVLLGFSGFVYMTGPSALWMVPGILAGYAAVWLWAGGVLQNASHAKGHLTLTDFLCEGASPGFTRAIRIVASLLIAFCFSYYVASQFQGAGVAFQELFGISLVAGVMLGALIILAYTFLGGFHAVSLIDTLQGLLMAIVAILLPALAFKQAGGWEGLSLAFADAPEAYRETFGGRAGFAALGFVVGLTATGFGALGQPHLASWIMAARDSSARTKGAVIALVWGATVYAGMAVLGLSARAIFGANAPPEGVFFTLSERLLPAMMGGVTSAAVLSAIMSTVDSQLLVAGAAISHDLGGAKALRGKDVLASRLAIVLVCAAAIAITFGFPSTIFERTLFAWTALGASFGPVVVARALKVRVSGPAALAGILTGFAASLVFEFLLPQGPGAVWARTVPWALAFLALFLGLTLKRPAKPLRSQDINTHSQSV